MRYFAGLFVSALVVLSGDAVAAAAPPAHGVESSATELVDTLPSAWGEAWVVKIRSEALNEERTVRLLVPRQAEGAKRAYPVVYLTDGEYYFADAATAAHVLWQSGHIPECIVAAIETPERRVDLTPPGMDASLSDGQRPRGEALLDFIVRELHPVLQARYRAGTTRVLAGHSHGGILCAYAAANRRADFPLLLAIDAPVQLDDGRIAATLRDSRRGPGALHLTSIEVRFGWSDEYWRALVGGAPESWRLDRIKLDDETHETMVFEGFYRGLKSLFRSYSHVRTKRMRADEAFVYYQSIRRELGEDCVPPRVVVARGLRELTALGKGEEAREALAMLTDVFGERDQQAERAAEIENAERTLRGQPTVDQMLATPAPTEEEIRPFLGEWNGTRQWNIAGSSRRAFGLTIGVENGQAVVIAHQPDAPAERRNERYQYVRVTPEGIEFGNRNGMFPPGVHVISAAVDGTTMRGRGSMKGVYVVFPVGEEPPVDTIELRRK